MCLRMTTPPHSPQGRGCKLCPEVLTYIVTYKVFMEPMVIQNLGLDKLHLIGVWKYYCGFLKPKLNRGKKPPPKPIIFQNTSDRNLRELFCSKFLKGPVAMSVGMSTSLQSSGQEL